MPRCCLPSLPNRSTCSPPGRFSPTHNRNTTSLRLLLEADMQNGVLALGRRGGISNAGLSCTALTNPSRRLVTAGASILWELARVASLHLPRSGGLQANTKSVVSACGPPKLRRQQQQHQQQQQQQQKQQQQPPRISGLLPRTLH